jgi:spore coat polysaccharide biosynthesis protein SpsF
MKTVCIIQARTGSSRLPGKVLKPLCGRPMLLHVVERVRRAATIAEVVVATTVEPDDQAIVTLCAEHRIAGFRGSEQDVLDRYYQAAREARADIVVRVTSDCPLIDATEIDRVVSVILEPDSGWQYVSNSNPDRTFPRGLDTEVFTFCALETAWREAKKTYEREHVTLFIWQQPERFPQYCVRNSEDFSHHRWTVDTPEDFELIERIYGVFKGRNDFSWTQVLALMDENPAWFELNQHVRQKSLE